MSNIVNYTTSNVFGRAGLEKYFRLSGPGLGKWTPYPSVEGWFKDEADAREFITEKGGDQNMVKFEDLSRNGPRIHHSELNPPPPPLQTRAKAMSEEQQSSMYMGGVGVRDRTRRLTKLMWDAVPMAVLGSMLMVFGLGMAGGTALSLYRDFIQWGWGSGAMIAVGVALGCVGYLGPREHYRAERALRDHQFSLDAETERRGRGWAKS